MNAKNCPDRSKINIAELPKHLFMPEAVAGVDMRKVCTIIAGSVKQSLFSFVCPVGNTIRFLSYGIFSDALSSADTEFIPTVNGNRIFPYHGDPSNNFKMSLGLAPDLSNNSLIPCQLQLNPGDKLEWFVTNIAAIDTFMGVRMVGYLDSAQSRAAARFGG